ncbi:MULTISPECIES: hypothetical protein [Edwardsiella]|uniref:Uncharacterized protein n=2 Tax=Edwardsiella anguillarum TaxID=1821960 RepID=A0A076LP62_9GAMM|nr:MULTISPECIES: hypothetical protein [Edwardsiella]AIJ08492.1 Hypothetical protein ETEE_2047 [Edwardsiella anguillarum ET080813]UBU94813.1 hypothetical protein AAZ33_18465 [Edwardsiella sp. LADL05-105]UOU79441.1 hypothetical protein MUN71_02105 [Edwardsiella anguillarum]WHP80580.1 hypothetical protein MQ090_01375 [Edwardsiella anguillarum]WHP84155.1 hypothetical protein MQ095_01325 [Edwardsiella anguillarum]
MRASALSSICYADSSVISDGENAPRAMPGIALISLLIILRRIDQSAAIAALARLRLYVRVSRINLLNTFSFLSNVFCAKTASSLIYVKENGMLTSNRRKIGKPSLTNVAPVGQIISSHIDYTEADD